MTTPSIDQYADLWLRIQCGVPVETAIAGAGVTLEEWETEHERWQTWAERDPNVRRQVEAALQAAHERLLALAGTAPPTADLPSGGVSPAAPDPSTPWDAADEQASAAPVTPVLHADVHEPPPPTVNDPAPVTPVLRAQTPPPEASPYPQPSAGLAAAPPGHAASGGYVTQQPTGVASAVQPPNQSALGGYGGQQIAGMASAAAQAPDLSASGVFAAQQNAGLVPVAAQAPDLSASGAYYDQQTLPQAAAAPSAALGWRPLLLEQLASIDVELTAKPVQVLEILARHGFDLPSYQQEDARWQQRFEVAPHLRHRYLALVEYYRPRA
ncbi:MAG: hypothetical protein JW751_16550 [Polyangiaceae bacterium]|nr:hypothetical protein [Polyangiaceae bacterium]